MKDNDGTNKRQTNLCLLSLFINRYLHDNKVLTRNEGAGAEQLKSSLLWLN